jgi:hypothetical protein
MRLVKLKHTTVQRTSRLILRTALRLVSKPSPLAGNCSLLV